MSAKYSCFVISPIGEPRSATREQADEAFEYVIKPALDRFDFTVERADHIVGITDTITKEMIERIQRSDLCVVDLTGLNPNVMYECGRRHETGKPCILISRETVLPFDVATHPVIRYTLEGDAKEVLKTIRTIQQNVQHFVESGFERSGGKTIGDVYREVNAINQKLDVLIKRSMASLSGSGATPAPDVGGLIKQLGGVVAAINYALANDDAQLLDQLLPRAARSDSENFVRGALVHGSYVGSRVAFEMLEEVILSSFAKFDPETKAMILSSYASGALTAGVGERALPIVVNALEQIESEATEEPIPAGAYAMILNASQRLCHSLGRYEEAIKYGDRILSLDTGELSYLYNQSLNYSECGQIEKSLEFIDMYVEVMRNRGFEGSDDDHLSHAIVTYAECGRLGDARELYLIMEQQHPLKATIVRADPELSKVFDV